MSRAAFPPHLKWAAPGEPLLFRQRLEAEGKWPPSLGKAKERDDRERPPATPFLVIPEHVGDLGTGARTRWASSPSVFLLSEDGKLETTPRDGISYRIAAIVANGGVAPSLGAFAEFAITRFVIDPAHPVIAPDQINPNTFADTVSLGVMTCAVRSLSAIWVLSPVSWTYHKAEHQVFAAAVQVYDPLFDASDGTWHSQTDRKSALKLLLPHVTGSWSGRQIVAPLLGQAVDEGPVSIQVAAVGGHLEQGDGSANLMLDVAMPQFPNIGAGFGNHQSVALTMDGFGLNGFHRPRGTDVVYGVTMDFTRKGSILAGGCFLDEVHEATLSNADPAFSDFDKALIHAAQLITSPTAPASRRADNEAIAAALAALP